MGVWIEESTKRFPSMQVYFWYGSIQSTSAIHKHRYIHSDPAALIAHIGSFPDALTTEEIVILSSYTTLRDRSLEIYDPNGDLARFLR